MNINFRKSLRRSSRSSTFYLESIEMYDRLKHISLEDVNKYTNSSASLPIIDFRADENVINRVKPISSVFKYDLNSDRSKGTVGQIVLTNLRLIFIPYSHETDGQQNGQRPADYRAESDLNGDLQSFNFPPFELVTADSDKSNEDVEYLNIYDLICKEKVLQIYCSDFRCLEFGLRSATLVKYLADYLDRLIDRPFANQSPISQLSQNLSPNRSPSMSSLNSTTTNQIVTSRCYELTYFWAMIGSQYSFNFPKDWEANEGYWYSSNSLLRISQANENYQLCKSLPASFITLRYYLTDVNLLQNISARMKGQRVPVITYSHKCTPKQVNKTRRTNRFNHHYQELQLDHMLIRSGIISKEDAYLLQQAISPLKIMDVNDLMPDRPTFISTYFKLREACFLHSNSTHFLSQIGKWMKLVCRVLIVVNDLSKLLSEESSLILTEHNDNHWNVLLSCLIQIQLDKRRRTIEGFNSLLSKEWLYLVSGLRSTTRLERSKLPDQLLFTMFLDCVYQMLHQNPTSFEFTSLYLIRCFDLSFKPCSAVLKLTKSEQPETAFRTPIKTRHHGTFHKSSPIHFSKLTSPNSSLSLYHNYHPSSSLSPILKNLTFTQTLFYFNPFVDKQQPNFKLPVDSGVLSVQFWRPLYLRWSKPFRCLDYYNQFGLREYLYFKELVEQNAGFKRIVQLAENKSDRSLSHKSSDNFSSASLSLNGAQSTDLEDSFEHF